MSFFTNPFSYKRRRESEELELGTPDQIAPETPPTASEHLRSSSSGAEADSPSLSLSSDSSQQQDTTNKVRSRAQYFESLIRSKAQGGAAATEEEGTPCEEKDGDFSPSTRKTGFVLTNQNEDLPTTQQQRPSQTAALFGGLTAAAAADALQNLRLELTRVENERHATVEALRRKTQEVDNLQNIVRELSESRAAALSARATLAEQYVDLSRAHERVTRVADLSRAVSKENLELTKNARSIAAEASKEAAEARKEAEAAGKAESRAAEENAVLRQKVNLLERLVTLSCSSSREPVHHFSGESVCRPEFSMPMETY
ncbi:hypothetical protein Ndes2526B_g08162 [Nannochloris sp. 'desiccata']|nr:hypothetical protein KSW81_002793 [Chlorella desiccata (nom. nud.)]KAH7617557.1 hypothetical protein NADE_007335 [Chlorella desiccata (nom. nud.)]